MDKLYKKKLEKILNKIDKIAAKGKDSIQEYTNYVNELVEKGDFSTFVEVLYLFYYIDVYEKIDVGEVISYSWKEILFQTKTPFLTKLSKLYKQNKIHQQSYQIYSDDPKITQLSLSNKYSSTYSVTGLSASISFFRENGNIMMKVLDNSIDSIEIKKAEWQTIVSYSGEPYKVANISSETFRPVNQKLIDEFYISYFSNSQSLISIDSLTSSQNFTMSILPNKSFQKEQIVKVSSTEQNQYFQGYINSYNILNGDLNLTITGLSGSGTYSNWIVEYVSGTQSPTFKTNVSVDYANDYAVYTYNTKDNENFIYRLQVSKNAYLGEIEEIDTYSQNAKYLVQNKQYAKIIGERKFYLKVTKSGSTQSYAIVYENESLSEDQNLLERYRLAVNYLLN
jgi:hypothetical protein